MEESSFDDDCSDTDENELNRSLRNCVCPNCGCSDPDLVHLVEIDDGELFINVCSDCNYSFGLEDPSDCPELRNILEKRGVIRTLLSPCKCGNENIDRFIYLGPDDAGQERIQCMNCKKCSEANINISYFEETRCDKDVSKSSSKNNLERNQNNVISSNDSKSCKAADFDQSSLSGYFFCEICQNEDPEYWIEFGNRRVKCLKCQSIFNIPEFYSEILHDSAAHKSSSIIVQERSLKGNISSNTSDSGIALSACNSVSKCHEHNEWCSCEDNATDLICSKRNKSSSAFNLCGKKHTSVSISPDVSTSRKDKSLRPFNFSKVKEMFENGFDENTLKHNKCHSITTISRRLTELHRTTPVRREAVDSSLRYCASNPNLSNIPRDVKSNAFDFNKTRSVFEAISQEDNGGQVSKRKIKSVLNHPVENACEQKYCKNRQITVSEICSSAGINNNLRKVSTRKVAISCAQQSTTNSDFYTNRYKNRSSPTVSDNLPENYGESGPKFSTIIQPKRKIQEPASALHATNRPTRRTMPTKVAKPEPDPPPCSDAIHRSTKRVNDRKKDNPKRNGKLGQTLITSLDMLKRGDHICWHRDYIVYHHAIVDQVLDNSLLVFENIGHILPKKGKFAKVEKNKYHFKKSGDMLYRVDYDESLILSIDETLERANSRVNEAKYNFFTNNCEHFATWCKTGKAKSGQVDTLVGRLGLMASEMSVKVGEEGVKIGAQFLTQGGAPSLDLIKNAGLRNGLRIIEDAAVGSVNGGLIALGIGINLAVDVSSFAYHTYQAYREYKKGKISLQDFKRKRMKIGGECLGRFIGSSTLGIVGNFICPVIGGVIGATLGGFIGRLIGAALGKKLSERCYRKI